MRNEAHMNYLRRKTADEAELWAADRIEALEADRQLQLELKTTYMRQLNDVETQLAEAQARIDELTTMCEDLECEAKDFAYKLEQKTVQLVEAHAALALKDEAFQKIIDIRIIPATTYGIARTALAIKPDNSALREWGARLLEELDDADQKGTLYWLLRAKQLRSGEWTPEEMK